MSNILFYEPFYDFERFFEHALAPSVNNNHGAQQLERKDVVASRPFKPRLDLHENTEKNLVTASFELPGIKKDDVQLDVHNNILTVSAENKFSTEHEESGYAVRERRYGRFTRSLRLPQGVKDDEIKAIMADGLLTITFPKSSPEQEPKKIAIA